MIDFEQGMIAALNQEYSLLTRKGCLFHPSKSIYRHVQELGLSQRYMNDDQFRTNIRMTGALGFVPIEDTVQTFETLAVHCGEEEQAVLDYFESTYIGEVRRGRRQQPMFPHELWNMNIRVQEDLPRTNNELEGWHTRFSTSFLHYLEIIYLPISGNSFRS